MAKGKGDAAFPSRQILGKGPTGGDVVKDHAGMTLRDYFAAKAPITTEDAMLACGCDSFSVGMLTYDQRVSILFMLAEMRFEYADAMLAERSKP